MKADRPFHTARHVIGTKATQVKNEGAFPPADARTYRLEEGCDERRFDATLNLLPKQTRKGEQKADLEGGQARSVENIESR
jgi:hypothetical protein